MRVGISTGGGDCPGLNAVIRAAVHTAVSSHGWEVVGIEDGLQGLLQPRKLVSLSPARVRGILPLGGTILGSTNRGNPFSYPVEQPDGSVVATDLSPRVMDRIRDIGLDAMLFVGGDGTQAIAQGFRERGLDVVGIPKTIDNDLDATDYTFGFDTAVNIAMEALDRLHTTAESHDRVMVLEVMGRDAGWIALHAGMAGGADVILLPEIPYHLDAVLGKIAARRRSGTNFSLVVIAEGAAPADGDVALAEGARIGQARRYGGAAERLVEQLREAGEEDVRATVLGHIQRGGTPTHFDRMLGTRFGVHAIGLVAEGRFGRMVNIRGTTIGDVDLREAIGELKRVDPDGQLVAAARSVGISFGDG
ncbi:MAG: ATP-dependent 6-phosphofructokinase [Deltaproteobacteria bacterium]|nr:MAG: ATP-dependent 6-phosphofructokinase [Deltaproteobacteria bacterium]